ncbi:MAG: hypothetical protein RIF39_17585, partial [Cyclobacteriaceae bacterium]
IDELKLPSVSTTHSPIFYLGLGLPRVGYNMVKRLLSEGYYANIGIFPAVPVKCTGLRLPITNAHTNDDIKNVLEAFSYHFPKVLEEEGMTVDNVSRSFNLPFAETKGKFSDSIVSIKKNNFEIQHEHTIHNIDKDLWDHLLGDIGNFDWEGCRFLEETFSDNDEPENNWSYHYLIIRDASNKPILATFFTELICKDDMISPAAVSQKIEEIRATDKYYLASKVVMMGSLISVGDHLYLDKKNPLWKNAMIEMLRIMNEVKQSCGATALQLRDLDSNDVELRDFLIKEGFLRIEMPEIYTIEDTKWKDENDYIARFSSKSRWHFKRMVLSKQNDFEVRTLSGKAKVESGNFSDWYKLYYNVKKKSYNINTYALPIKYFSNMIDHPNWEIVELRLKSIEPTGNTDNPLISVAFCYKSSKNNYSMMAVGLDYDYVLTHGSYRQCMYQSVVRANYLGSNKVYLGMDAAVEKKRFGATVFPKSVYIQANDNYNFELIGAIQGNN